MEFHHLDESIRDFVFSLSKSEEFPIPFMALSSAMTKLLNTAETRGVSIPKQLEDLDKFLEKFPKEGFALYLRAMLCNKKQTKKQLTFLIEADELGCQFATYELAENHPNSLQRNRYSQKAGHEGNASGYYYSALDLLESKLTAPAERVLRKAVNLGHVKSMKELANMLLMQNNPANDPEIFSLLKLAADNNSVQAMLDVAYLYYAGKGTAKDIASCLHYLHLAASKGSLNAGNALFRFYQTYPPENPRFDLVYKNAQMLAEAGEKYAQEWLGLAFLNGYHDEISIDVERATFWLMKAKTPSATYELAKIYQSGLAGEIDLSKAIEFYKIAAEMGDKKAMHALVSMVADEQAIRVNPADIASYAKILADDKFDENSNLVYAGFCLAGYGEPKNDSRAYDYFKLAVGSEQNMIALFQCADMLSKGQGVKINDVLARQYRAQFKERVETTESAFVDIVLSQTLVSIKAEIIKFLMSEMDINNIMNQAFSGLLEPQKFMYNYLKIVEQMLATAETPAEIVDICQSVAFHREAPECYIYANFIAGFAVYDTVLQMTSDPMQAWQNAKQYFDNIFEHDVGMQLNPRQCAMYGEMLAAAFGKKIISEMPSTHDSEQLKFWQAEALHQFAKISQEYSDSEDDLFSLDGSLSDHSDSPRSKGPSM